MKIAKQRTIALGTLAVLGATTFGGMLATPAQAKDSKKWKNWAIAGGAVTGYGLLKKNKTAAIVGGVGTVYAYSKYRKAKKKEDRTEEARRIQWYKTRYGRNWRAHYQRGA